MKIVDIPENEKGESEEVEEINIDFAKLSLED